MSILNLIFDGKAFPVAKKSVFELLAQRNLFEATSYTVQSPVPGDLFEIFVDSLKAQKVISVTKETAVSLSLLAKEFSLPDLAAECATFPVSIDQFSSLCDRVSALERQLSFFSQPRHPIEEKIETHEEGLENLRLGLERLETSVERLMRNETSNPTQSSPAPNSASASSADAPSTVVIPMKGPKSLDGIIAYLTKKHGGNVHEKGIVRLTSKSVDDDPRSALKNLADLASTVRFWSKNEPDQWVCWDFQRMRVRPTHYTITGFYVRSWVLEGSNSGKSWTKLDRQTEIHDAEFGWFTASSRISKPAEFRLFRLTQTAERAQCNGYDLPLRAVEFFGTLSE
jgi:hypothetical protein